MSAAYWQHYPHIADIGIRGVADTRAGAFEQAALALTAVITDIDRVKANTVVTISCQAPDDELLLVEWLNTVIYEMAVRHMLFARFNVNIQDGELTASLSGEQVNINKHQPAVEVKGATVTDLKVGRNDQGQWLAQCVVDV